MSRSWLILLLAWGATAHAVPLTIVGTNDLHGQVERVAALAGHVDILRAQAKKAGGAVVLVDAGDMFQGTLESNLKEGAAVVAAYNRVGYDAVCIGNHEFDFGPVGDHVVSKAPGEDPRGALKARAAEARFPFLAANILDERGAPVAWPNVKPTALVKAGQGKAKIPVGFVGLATVDTPKTTIFSNVKDLRFAALEETVLREAAALRQAGARVVVVVAHAGGRCDERAAVDDLATCEAEAEIMKLARALPPGLVDVIVAGHTHQTMAHVVNGIAIIESWANGRGFGRVDLDVDVSGKGQTKLTKVHPPRRLCGDDKEKDHVAIDACTPSPYEGATPKVDAALLKAIAPYFADAKARRAAPIGVHVEAEIKRGYDRESPLGNLFADLMLEAAPGADVALMNGGGIRANLPPGPLLYGAVFEMMPFDNRMATVTMSAADLRAILARNLAGTKKGGIFSTAGVQVTITCDDLGRADPVLTRADGRPIPDDTILKVVTTDFVAGGGDGGLGVGPDRVVVDEGDPLREHLAAALRRRGGRLRPDDPTIAPATPRLHRPGAASARCGGA